MGFRCIWMLDVQYSDYVKLLIKVLLAGCCVLLSACGDSESFVDKNPIVSVEYFSSYATAKKQLERTKGKKREAIANNEMYVKYEKEMPSLLAEYESKARDISSKNLVIKERNKAARQAYDSSIGALRAENVSRQSVADMENQKIIQEYNSRVDTLRNENTALNDQINTRNNQLISSFKLKRQQDLQKLWDKDVPLLNAHRKKYISDVRTTLYKSMQNRSNAPDEIRYRAKLQEAQGGELYDAASGILIRKSPIPSIDYFSTNFVNKALITYKRLAESDHPDVSLAKELGLFPDVLWRTEDVYSSILNRPKPSVESNVALRLPREPVLTKPELISESTISLSLEELIPSGDRPRNSFSLQSIEPISRRIDELESEIKRIKEGAELLGFELDWEGAYQDIKDLAKVDSHTSALSEANKILIILRENEG